MEMSECGENSELVSEITVGIKVEDDIGGAPIDIGGSEVPMEVVEEDTMWLTDLQINPDKALPLERLSFRFANFDIGIDIMEAITGNSASRVPSIPQDCESVTVDAVTVESVTVDAVDNVTAAGMEQVESDLDREVQMIAGLRPAPHPELLSAGKGKEKSPSSHNDKWSLRRVDQLRSSLGWNMKTSFGDLPLDQIDTLLNNLFARVVKVSGEEYPAASLMNMLGGYNRIIRRASDQRALDRIDFPPPVCKDFNIKKHPQFVKTRLVLKAALRKTARDGTNKKTTKVEILTEAMEEAIFADLEHQITDSQGCQKRLVLFLVVRCGIRGGKELHELRRDDVAVLIDSEGRDYVQFTERHNKNNNYSLDRYAEHQFRKPYVLYESGFVMCVKQYMRHMPEAEKSQPDLLLQPIVGPASIVWYNRVQKVGRDKCGGYLKNMASLVCINPDVFTNKSGRATLITRMAARGVPDEVGMLLSGHHTVDGYSRYDRTQAIKMEAAALVAADPSFDYQTALAQVSAKFVGEKVVGNHSEYKPLMATNSNTSEGSSASARSSAACTDRVTGKAVAISMCNEVKEVQKRMMVVEPEDQSTVRDTEQKLKVSNPVQQQQLSPWLQDYDNIDWEEECRKNPSLQKVLGGGRGGGGSHVLVGSRIGSSLAGNNFHLGLNCVINFICDRKDDKENKPVN